jgi:hypothetical protein
MARLLANLKGPITFLRTELQTGFTLIFIARAAKDEAKLQRNLQNARKAFESARHFLGRVQLTAEEDAELREKLAALEAELKKFDNRV